MTREAFARQIAAKVAADELKQCAILGHGHFASWSRCFRAMDETYEAVYAEDRSPVTMGMRMIGGKP